MFSSLGQFGERIADPWRNKHIGDDIIVLRLIDVDVIS